MRKLLVKFLTAMAAILMLCSCSQEPVVVGASALKISPEKFAGKRIKFYLDGVMATIGTGADPSDPLGNLVSLDSRIVPDYRISMTLKPELIPRWKDANLAKYHRFTVTLTGTLTPVTSDKLTLYKFSADDFVINADNGERYVAYSGAKTDDGLPSEILELPQPTRIEDANKVGLFPDQFKGKPLLIEAMVSKDDFKPGVEDTVQLHTYPLTFILSKEMAASVYDKVTSASFLEIVGNLDSARAANGTPLIIVKHVRFVR